MLLEASLYYKEYNKTSPDENKENSDQAVSPDYERVCNKIYRLGNVMLGIHKYVPIEFTNDFSSLL